MGMIGKILLWALVIFLAWSLAAEKGIIDTTPKEKLCDNFNVKFICEKTATSNTEVTETTSVNLPGNITLTAEELEINLSDRT